MSLSQVEKIAKEALHLVESREVTREPHAKGDTSERGLESLLAFYWEIEHERGPVNLPLQCISEEALLPPHELNLFLKR